MTIHVVCVACKEEKDASVFGRDSRKVNGLKSACKECSNSALRAWRAANPEKASQIEKKRYESNPQKRRDASRAWYEDNKSRALENNKNWRVDNREKVRDDGREYARKWRANNPEKAKNNARECQKRRRLIGRNRLDDSIRSSVSSTLRRGAKSGQKTYALLGYTLNELVSHLEAKFSRGMSWANYGKWHVDHINPLSSHEYESPDDEDFKRAWSLSNLQPLWGKENQRKGAKLDWPTTTQAHQAA